MLTITDMINRLRDCYSQTDRQEHPELSHYIASILIDGIPSPMELSVGLQCAEPSKDLPRCVFDLVAEILQDEIAAGNDDAMADLGSLYFDGRGCQQDYSKALYYYHMASTLGNRQAQENLGYCYYYGCNVAVDYEKAFRYFCLGAFEGNLTSLYKIGDLYLNGHYLPQNGLEAYRIYQHCLDVMEDESTELASGPVYLRLGRCFLEGIGVEADPNRALVCFQKAEWYLYDMIKNAGDRRYLPSLKQALLGQDRARRILMRQL